MITLASQVVRGLKIARVLMLIIRFHIPLEPKWLRLVTFGFERQKFWSRLGGMGLSLHRRELDLSLHRRIEFEFDLAPR